MAKAPGCFYCEEHHEKRDSIMYLVGKMSTGTLYLFRDQSHKGRCVLALDDHKKEVFELTDGQRSGIISDVSKVAEAIKKLWGCNKINIGSFGDTNPHLHFHIVPKYEGGLDFGGGFTITRADNDQVILDQAEYDSMIAALKSELKL